MSGLDVLAVCVYALSTVALGALFLLAVAAPSLLRSAAVAYLAGQLIWLLLYQLAIWMHVPATMVVWGAGGLGLAWGAIAAWRSRWYALRWLLGALLLVAIVACCFPHALYTVLRVPLIEWDARSIWLFHGKAIWVHGGIAPDYFADPSFARWSHTDYPLLLPVQSAVIGVLRGEWSEMAVKGFLGLNFMAYLWLLHATLVRRGWSHLLSWCASILMMGVALAQYVNGYADNHYAMPLALAALLAFQPNRSAGCGALAALLAGIALNVKNEAFPYVLLGAVLWGLLWLVRHMRGHRKESWLPTRCMWGILLVGVVPFCLWLLFRSVHGVEGDLHLGSRLLTPGASISLWIQRAPVILDAMGRMHVQLHTPLLFGMVLALTLWARVLAKDVRATSDVLTGEEHVLWGGVVVTHLLLLSVYGLTPYDVRWHLGTSLSRLLVLPVLLLAGLGVCAVEKVLGYQGNRPPSEPVGK
ncbi:MAG: hypothetical protein HN341_00520 [Verrucomicrobia bacterium]|jgi:hypothetical protein|nr:hypothetical protein [Verrucomicrobiota bacterium]